MMTETKTYTLIDGRKVATEIKQEIRRAVHAGHRIQVHDVVLLKPGTLPLTTTGKLQRRDSRDRYLGGSFEAALVE